MSVAIMSVIIFQISVEGPWGVVESGKMEGNRFVDPRTYILYAYVSGSR